MDNPAGLIVLIAVPAVVVLYGYRRRLPVRRVSAVFLWGTPRVASRRTGGSFSLRPAWALARDLVAVLLLAALACGVQFRGGSVSDESWRRADAAYRIVLCLAAAAILVANWRRAGAAARDQAPAGIESRATTEPPRER